MADNDAIVRLLPRKIRSDAKLASAYGDLYHHMMQAHTPTKDPVCPRGSSTPEPSTSAAGMVSPVHPTETAHRVWAVWVHAGTIPVCPTARNLLVFMLKTFLCGGCAYINHPVGES